MGAIACRVLAPDAQLPSDGLRLLRLADQDADNATLHWALEPVRRPKAGTGHGSAGRGRHWPALGTGVPAEGRHWPALGARRSAVLPAEGRRWLGRRPGTAARAVCARRSEQCAMYGARLSSMRTLYILLYILLYGSRNLYVYCDIYINIRERPKIYYS